MPEWYPFLIPPSEVRFIQECKTDKARKAVIDAMNAGTVRVLFGSPLCQNTS